MSEGARAAALLHTEVDGQERDDLVREVLVEAVIDDERNLPDACTLVFTDAQGGVLEQGGFEIGKALKLSVGTERTQAGGVIFDGEITAVEVHIEEGTRQAVVRGYDSSHRLQRGTHTETHLDMTYGDIAERIAQRRGLSVGEGGSVNVVHPAVVQWNQTDWEFLNQLAAEVGHEAVVADGKLHFRSPTSASSAPGEAAPDTAGERQLVADNIRRLRATVNAAEQVGTVEVRGWDPATKREVVGSADATRASSHQGGADPAALAGAFGSATLVRTHLPVESQELAAEAARSIVDQLGSVAAEIEGIVDGDPSLRSGVTVSLSSLGSQFDGKYTLTSCRHVFSQHEGYLTHFRVSGRQTRTLLGLATNGGARLAGAGLVSGVVCDIEDTEGFGRVKVTFPWLHPDAESPWARVLSVGGGKDRGVVWMPEVNDEVLVGFDHGDHRLPYVLGGLHNGEDVQPSGPGALTNGGVVERRTLVSREGQHLTFDDSDRSIRLATKSDEMKLTFEGSDSSVTLASDGTISIESSGDMTFKSGGKVVLEATTDCSIKAQGVSIDAGPEFSASGVTSKVEGSAQVEVSSSGQATVRGSLVQIN